MNLYFEAIYLVSKLGDGFPVDLGFDSKIWVWYYLY